MLHGSTYPPELRHVSLWRNIPQGAWREEHICEIWDGKGERKKEERGKVVFACFRGRTQRYFSPSMELASWNSVLTTRLGAWLSVEQHNCMQNVLSQNVKERKNKKVGVLLHSFTMTC